MKKFVSIILSALLILGMTACSSEKSASDEFYGTDSNPASDIVSDNDTEITTDTDLIVNNNTDSATRQSLQSGIIFDIDEETNTDINVNTDIYTYSNNFYNSDIPKTNVLTCKIFKKVVCCGDSYTAGYIVDSEGKAHPVNEDYAWPHYMSTLTGNDWYNCGCTGCTVITWQQRERGLPAVKKLGKSQAYVIGLMINDVIANDHVELGTVNDIGTDKKTYYAGMSKIIRELNAISPKAKIFVNTCPKPEETYINYNQAVRDIVNIYKNQYPVHCIDLAANSYMYENESLKNDYLMSHYTAIGYEQFSEIYAVILSNYINEHIEDFQDVAFIEYDK